MELREKKVKRLGGYIQEIQQAEIGDQEGGKGTDGGEA